jgi:CRP-like cAMP-binding protein
MANGAGGQTIKALQPGEYLCFQGEESNEVFVLRSGELDIYVVDTEGVVSRDKVENSGMLVGSVDQAGSFIGEIGAILKEPRSASIKVSDAGPVEVMVINLRGKGFDATVAANPKIGFSLSKTIAQRLAMTSQSINRADSLTLKAKERIESHAKNFFESITSIEQLAQSKSLDLPLVADAKKTMTFQIGRMINKYGSMPVDFYGTVGVPFVGHDTIFHNRIYAKGSQTANLSPEASGPPKPGVTAFKPGDVICKEKTVDTAFYFLLAGKLEVFVGMRPIEVIQEKGAILGENAIFGQLERSSGIRALTDVHAMAIPAAKIEPYLMQKPPLVVHVLKMFAKRLPLLNSMMMKTAQQMAQMINMLGQGPDGCLTAFETFAPRVKSETAAAGTDAEPIVQGLEQNYAELASEFEALNAEYDKICQDTGYKYKPYDAAPKAAGITAPKFNFVTKVEELELLDSEHINFVINPKTDQFRACSIEFGHIELFKQAKVAEANWKEFIQGRIINQGESFPSQFLVFDVNTGDRDYILRALKGILERGEQEVALLFKEGACIELMHIPDYVKMEGEDLVDEAAINEIIEAFRKKPDDRDNLAKLNALFWDLIIATVQKKLPRAKDNIIPFEDKDLELVNFGLLDHAFLPDNSNVIQQITDDKNFDSEELPIKFIYLSDMLQDIFKEAFGQNKLEVLEQEKKKVEGQLKACQDRVQALLKGRAAMVAAFPGGANAAQFVQKYDTLVRGMAVLERKMKAGRSLSNEERGRIVQAKNVKTQLNTQIAGFLTALKGKVPDDKIAQFRDLGTELEKRVLEDLLLQDLVVKKDDDVKQHVAMMKAITIKQKETTYKNEMIRIKKYVLMTAKKCQIDPTAVLVGVRDIATKTRVKVAIELFIQDSVDPEIFDPKQPRIKQLGVPQLMLVPGSGDAVYDWEKHMFMVPLISPKSLEESVANAFVEFHWDMDDDKSLRESYGALKVNSKLSITALKKQLAKDYVIWATQESKGWKKLDKEVRAWFQVKIGKQKIGKDGAG